MISRHAIILYMYKPFIMNWFMKPINIGGADHMSCIQLKDVDSYMQYGRGGRGAREVWGHAPPKYIMLEGSGWMLKQGTAYYKSLPPPLIQLCWANVWYYNEVVVTVIYISVKYLGGSATLKASVPSAPLLTCARKRDFLDCACARMSRAQTIADIIFF